MARNLIKTIEDTRKNYIINGDMRIAQRGTSFAAVAHLAYTIDRFKYEKNGAMVHTITQDTDVPTVAQAGQLFSNSMRLNLTTPDTSIAAGDYCFFEQFIEGYNWAQLAQKPFTLSFWVKATTAGVYSVSFLNSDNSRTYTTEYTISSANTWEKKTITVSASPSGGNWNYTSGTGLRVCFILASGTTFQTSVLNTWNTSLFLAGTNQINGVNTGATDFRVTGVVVNEGSTASPFSYFGGDFDGEIKACQRYYEKSFPLTFAPGTASSAEGSSWAQNIAAGTTRVHVGTGNAVFKVAKRSTSNTFRVFNHRGNFLENFLSVYNGDTNQAISTANMSANQNGFDGYIDALANDTVWGFHWTVDSEL